MCQCNTPCCIAKRRSTPCCNCDDNECPWSVLQIGATCGSAYIECATIGLFVAIATPSPIFVAAAAAVSHTTSRKRRNARVPPAGSIRGCVVPLPRARAQRDGLRRRCACGIVCDGLCMRACVRPQHEGANTHRWSSTHTGCSEYPHDSDFHTGHAH